jgi:hypothetical protein
MKKYARLSALLACVFLLSTASAEASERVRLSQMRLADLGYYAGHFDGVMGPVTKIAIKDFQAYNGLPVSGKLTTKTYDLLVTQDYRHVHAKTVKHSNTKTVIETTTDNPWHFVSSATIPVRYGELRVDEDSHDEVHRFTITLNGRPFLRADNQPGELRISQVFNLSGEDAVIMTAWRGERNCMYKNYLITIHSNGISASTREFSSCAESSEVHEAFNALFVRFPGTMNKDGWASWDVWRYENSKLERL